MSVMRCEKCEKMIDTDFDDTGVYCPACESFTCEDCIIANRFYCPICDKCIDE